jgi:hypothetical protein
MWRRVALVRAAVLGKRISSIIRVKRIGEQGSKLTVTSNRNTIRRNIPEDDILHSHFRENLKSYTALTGWAL